MRNKMKLSPLFIVFIVLIVGACGSEKDRPEIKKERVASVKVMTMKKGDIVSSISLSGTLVPVRKARLGPKIEGKIEKIYADEGDYVKDGAPLIKLDQKNYLISKSEAEAGLHTAKAAFAKAEADLENSAKDYKRLNTLFQKGVIAEREFDAIYTRQKTAEAEVKLATAQVRQAEERLNMATQNLQDTIIKAPFSGFVVQKQMEEAEVSSMLTYQWSVLLLEDISRVKVECPVSENDIRFLNVGKEVALTVDAFPDKVFKGKVTQINSKVDERSRSFVIKIEIPNRDYKLKSGMFARVKVLKQKKEAVLYLPVKGLLIKGDENIAYKVSGGVAKACRVSLGISDGNTIEVMGGLKEGDVVVTEGFYAIRDGSRVEVLK